MKSVLFLSLCLAVAASAATTSSGVNAFNQNAYDALPKCAQQCIQQAIGIDYCSLTDTPCFCSNQSVTAAFSSCLETGCPVPTAVLYAEKYQAETCNYPYRSKQTLHRGVLWATWAFSTLFILLRFFSRANLLQGSGYSWDDFVIFFTYALAVVLLVATVITIYNGSALDEWRSTPAQLTKYMLWTYISEILYNTIIVSTKIAVMLLYLRIWTADRITRAFRVSAWLIILSLVLIGIAFDLGLILQCIPLSYIWENLYGGTAQCINLPALTYTFGALSVCYDVLVFFLPIHSLLKLRIRWQQKLGVIAVFTVGFVVTICTIVRLQYLVRFSTRQNATWVYQPISMWSIIEANLSIVCCCMPAAVGLFQRLWRWSKGEPLVVSTGQVSKQRDLSGSTGAQSGSTRYEKAHSDEESSPDSQSRAHLINVEQAPALGEKDGRAKKQAKGPGQVDQVETNSGDGVGASDVLERHKYDLQPRNSARGPGCQTALVHQASSQGQKVEISHEPPSKPSEVHLSYRDVDEVVHQVTLTDVPIGKIPGPVGGGRSSKGNHDGRDLTGLSVRNASPTPQSPYATR